jgi:hypothetical protein
VNARSVLLNLKEFRVQGGIPCARSAPGPTLRRSVESMKLSEGLAKHKECARSKVVSLYKLRRSSIECA